MQLLQQAWIKGRLAVHEIIAPNDDIRFALSNRNIEEVKKTLAGETIIDDGIQKVIEGKTTISEVIEKLSI